MERSKKKRSGYFARTSRRSSVFFSTIPGSIAAAPEGVQRSCAHFCKVRTNTSRSCSRFSNFPKERDRSTVFTVTRFNFRPGFQNWSRHLFREPSESFRKSGLFENAVGGVTRLDAGIDRKMAGSQGTEPYFVIAFSLADKSATVFPEDSFNIRGKIGHQPRTRKVRSERRWIVAVAGTIPESSNSSGTNSRNFSWSDSIVSASVTRPGTSSLSATQTLASSSQKARTFTSLTSIFCMAPPKSFFRNGGSRFGTNDTTKRICVRPSADGENQDPIREIGRGAGIVVNHGFVS